MIQLLRTGREVGKESIFYSGYNTLAKGEWQRYITNALLSHVPDFSDADYGTVLMRLMIDSDRTITDVRPLTMKTSMLAMIGFNAIDGGPKWIPAQYKGKKVKTILIQPLTIANPYK